MKKKELYIIIKYHKNPNKDSDKALPVIMMDTDDHPIEFDRIDSAQEFTNILNMNSNQGFHYEIKQLGVKYLKVSQKTHDK